MDPIFVLPVRARSECVGVFAHEPRASLRAEQITPIPSYTDKMSGRRKQVHSGPNEQVAARVPDRQRWRHQTHKLTATIHVWWIQRAAFQEVN